MRPVLIAIALLFALPLFAQNEHPASIPPEIYTFVEQMPRAPYDYNKYLADNLVYPDAAIKKDVEGRVVISFVVRRDGHIDSCVVLKGIGYGCDEAAQHVVSSMPPWTPGKQNGTAVDVYFVIPITFRLDKPAAAPVNGGYNNTGFSIAEPKYDVDAYLKEQGKYPAEALKGHTQGVVYLKTIIRIDGTTDSTYVISGPGAGCDEEALRLVGRMPAWQPQVINGMPRNVPREVALTFSLSGGAETITYTPKAIRKDAMPLFDLNAYLAKNIHYPIASVANPIDTLVAVQFVINSDASIDSIKINGSGGENCDAAVMDVIRKMPAWQPAMKYGKPIRTVQTERIRMKVAGTNTSVVVDTSKIYMFVDQMPASVYNMSTYLSEHLHYPDYARRNNIHGRVIVQFVVGTDGRVKEARVVKGIGGGCDEEALRVVSNMPPWRPGKQNGKPVSVYFTLPISFQLN